MWNFSKAAMTAGVALALGLAAAQAGTLPLDFTGGTTPPPDSISLSSTGRLDVHRQLDHHCERARLVRCRQRRAGCQPSGRDLGQRRQLAHVDDNIGHGHAHGGLDVVEWRLGFQHVVPDLVGGRNDAWAGQLHDWRDIHRGNRRVARFRIFACDKHHGSGDYVRQCIEVFGTTFAEPTTIVSAANAGGFGPELPVLIRSRSGANSLGTRHRRLWGTRLFRPPAARRLKLSSARTRTSFLPCLED